MGAILRQPCLRTGQVMGRPNLAARLNAEKPCGCVEGRRYCPQHWDLLTPQRRDAHIAALRLRQAEREQRRA